MKELIDDWLGQQTQLSGVLACGVRYSDKTAFTQTWSPDYPVPALENAWRCVSDTFQVLKINFLPGQRVRWVYENAFLYCTRRDDGVCLGIFTTKDPQAVNPDEINRLITEFHALGKSTPR
jgi:hypothetical protein